jgi:hypothetical protein
MKTTLLIVLTCFGWVSIGAATPDSHRKKLTQPTVIQGYPCAKGYAFFYADGKLDNCAVNQETQYGEALIPRGSIIYLKSEGSLWGVGLAHSTRIHDVLCDGGGFLGPAEGSETAFYPSGKLHQCYLAKNQVVQGVPCAQGGDAGISSWPRPRTLFPRRRPSAFLPARGGFRRPEEKHDLEVGCKIGGHFGLAHREPGVAVGTHSGARRRMGLFDRPHQRRQRRRV